MLDVFVQSMGSILSIDVIILMIIGVAVGIIFGAIPGLTATMAIVLALPMTYNMEVIPAMALFCALYIGGVSGGLISAILLNIPGTPSSIATTFDGHPLAKKGEAGNAISVGVLYSFLGGLLSFILLIFIAPPLANLAIRFGPYEFFAVAIFSLSMISGLSGDSLAKGLISGFVGIVLAFVGPAPIDAFQRFTFGIDELAAGFDLMTVMIGLFAISEILNTAKNSLSDEEVLVSQFNKPKGFGITLIEFKNQFVNFIRSSFIGMAMGILPGIGGSTSSILAYVSAKNASKTPEKFGKGEISGIIASESANNATVGGAMVPLLTMGIPGETTTAMILGAFMIHGLTPGPLLFVRNADVVYVIFAALMVSNVIMLVMEYFGMSIFAKVLTVPKHVLLPIVFALCTVGAYGLNNRIFDIWTILIFGLLGYAMEQFDYPSAPLILGFILGPLAETNLRSGLMLSNQSFAPFLQSPIALLFYALTLVSVGYAVVKNVRKNNAKRNA